jgi:TetR/AcrR family transcriptional regulator, cholesterol catabolism regulator
MIMGRPTAPSRVHTGQRIQETAVQLFYEKGYKATTIRDIAKASGLTPGAIYNHYLSKDDILYAIIRWSHDELDRDLAEALRTSGNTPLARLGGAARAFVLRHTQYPAAARVTNREYRAVTEVRRKEIVGRRRATRALFQRLIDQAASTDEAGKISADRVMITSMGVINMMIMVAEWYKDGGQLSAEAVAEHHAKLVVSLFGH